MEIKENALQFSIANYDESRRIVFGQVYQPNKIDAKGWYMEPEEVERMAHRYMRNANLRQSIDTNHDNVPNGCYPVQSFIARKNDPDGYVEGAWVLGVKITSDEVWNQITKGELNAFSMEIYVRRVPAMVRYEYVPNHVGTTEEASDHTHYFFAQIDETGKVIGGKTSITNGHSHEINLNSVTEEHNGHAHRFFVG